AAAQRTRDIERNPVMIGGVKEHTANLSALRVSPDFVEFYGHVPATEGLVACQILCRSPRGSIRLDAIALLWGDGLRFCRAGHEEGVAPGALDGREGKFVFRQVDDASAAGTGDGGHVTVPLLSSRGVRPSRWPQPETASENGLGQQVISPRSPDLLDGADQCH